MKNNPKWYPLLLLGFVLLLASSLIGCETSKPPPPPSSSSHPAIADSPSSFSFITEQGGSNPSSQTLEIQNSGDGTLDWSATDDADWLSLSPASGSCASGEINNVTVSVDASAISAGDYTATITISAPEATNTPQTVAVNLTITPITPTVTYSVSVAVSPKSQTGLPGDTLDDYTVTVTNTGTEADTYDLSISISDDYGWTLTAPSATSAIASGVFEDIIISLTIPEDAVPETEDEITIIATSQNDPTASDSTTCTAVVEEEPTPTFVSIIPSSTTISPGDTFTIDVVIDSATNNVKVCHVEVSYDSTVFTAGTITEAGLLGTNILTEPGSGASDGIVKYGLSRQLLAGNPAVPVSGTFISITFEVSQTASPDSYSLTIDATLLDENKVPIPGVVENDGLVIIVQ